MPLLEAASWVQAPIRGGAAPRFRGPTPGDGELHRPAPSGRGPKGTPPSGRCS